MKIFLLTLCYIFVAEAANTHAPTSSPTHNADVSHLLNDLRTEFDSFKQSMQNEFKALKQSVGTLSRQVMLQQLFVEERIRSDGDSGIKQIREGSDGTKPYHTNTFVSGAVCAVHDHANYDRTVGLGEFAAVLNGVEFRTRHNDYKLKMPSTTSKTYNAVEDVPFPPVPQSVLDKPSVQEQINEMREYFKAFHDQDTHHRNWKPYFKPALCYLEGGWTTNTKTLDEPFSSDRHFIDASSWFDLQEKIRYTSATGGKNQFENFSFLPTTIVNVTEDGEPIYAQWNYRIMCHPVKTQLELKNFNLIDDLAPRMRSHKNFTSFGQTRAARFRITPYSGGHFNKNLGYSRFPDRAFRYGILDRIMNEIPGKDNYGAHVTDNSFGMLKYRIDTKNLTVLNVANYHKWFKVTRPGAMGLNIRKRGYSDENMWVAKTTNPRIANMAVKDCARNKHTHKMECHKYESRYTYAIPLEIVWMTPLSKWNPYNLTVYTSYRDFHKISDNGRNGGSDKAKAYNGTTRFNYYITPAEFFHGGEVNKDRADTAKNSVGVLDQQGVVRQMSATGTRVFLPEIPGIGKIRQRYPIMPVHAEGSTTWKNMLALQDITMDMKRFTSMFEKRPEIQDLDARPADFHYVTSTTHMNPPGMHKHDIYIPVEEINALQNNGTTIHVYTTENNGHQHHLELIKNPTHTNQLNIISCDDGKPICWDHHSNHLYKQYS